MVEQQIPFGLQVPNCVLIGCRFLYCGVTPPKDGLRHRKRLGQRVSQAVGTVEIALVSKVVYSLAKIVSVQNRTLSSDFLARGFHPMGKAGGDFIQVFT